jgi:uncharacterized membrane protein YfcA
MPDLFATSTIILVALLGLLAGIVGGLAGLGGSMIMLPGLGLILGYSAASHPEQHVYMGAALIVNVLVALPATWRHAKNRNIDRVLLKRTLPGQALGVAAGVLLSNWLDGARLAFALGVMIAVVVVVNLVRAQLAPDKLPNLEQKEPLPSAKLLAPLSAAVGFFSGLVGLGGGALAIPMLQACGVAVKRAIGVSSAMIVATSTLGAILKLSTFDPTRVAGLDALQPGEFAWRVLGLAGVLGPLAAVGGMLGAELVRRLPTGTIRWIVSILLLIAAARMLNVW